MVDRSLETLAADRGITICFAEIDGVDGLWLPDERTILISSRLDDRRATEVLDHELSHVDIEDGHAALDATVRRRVGRTRFAMAAAAAASLLVLVAIRLQFGGQPTEVRQDPSTVAGHTTAPPQADRPRLASSPPAAPASTSEAQVFKGEVRTQTVTVTVTTSTPPATPAPSIRATVPPTGPTVPAGQITTPSLTTTAAPPPSTTPAPTPTGTAPSTPSPTAPSADTTG